MKELLQKIYDWYITGPREYFRESMYALLTRKVEITENGDHGLEPKIQEINLLPLSWSEPDNKAKRVMRRKFDRAARNYR